MERGLARGSNGPNPKLRSDVGCSVGGTGNWNGSISEARTSYSGASVGEVAGHLLKLKVADLGAKLEVPPTLPLDSADG